MSWIYSILGVNYTLLANQKLIHLENSYAYNINMDRTNQKADDDLILGTVKKVLSGEGR